MGFGRHMTRVTFTRQRPCWTRVLTTVTDARRPRRSASVSAWRKNPSEVTGHVRHGRRVFLYLNENLCRAAGNKIYESRVHLMEGLKLWTEMTGITVLSLSVCVCKESPRRSMRQDLCFHPSEPIRKGGGGT